LGFSIFRSQRTGPRSLPRKIDQLVLPRVALDAVTVNGDWNLQPEHLKDLCAKAGLLVKEFADIQLSWVPREMNLEADALASRALGRGR
jgi:Reverse transcriptase-like